jgi:hypothetical protein
MGFDLNNLNPGEWFRYFNSHITEAGETVYHDPAPDAERVCIKMLDPEILEEIQKKTRKRISEFVLNPRTRVMERVVYFDQTPEQEKLEREMTWDAIITGWEIKTPDDAPIPCTMVNKVRMMTHPPFARFVARCLQISASARKEADEAAEKN